MSVLRCACLVSFLLLRSECVRAAFAQNDLLNGLGESADLFVCGDGGSIHGHYGGSALRLGGCTVSNVSSDRSNVNCSGEQEYRGLSANLTDCLPTGDREVVFVGCSGTVEGMGDVYSNNISLIVSSCFANQHPNAGNGECGTERQPHEGAINCTETLSNFAKRRLSSSRNTVHSKSSGGGKAEHKKGDEDKNTPQSTAANTTQKSESSPNLDSVKKSAGEELKAPESVSSLCTTASMRLCLCASLAVYLWH
ncbi:hypothetical protein ERJ75_001206900 [Trypanosoma vivax]|nr:hypothetical protein TRVL_08936 [Trypanosoma vivax]KAH8609392.1 hypothetical protein ERJ75_001206900 [Trypanosoma vivax]